jgi:hypothetical protein
MATRKILLQEDINGTLPENHITNEHHDIGIGRNRLIVPEYGAFYNKSLVIKDLQGNVIDPGGYSVYELYEEAADKSGEAVYNSIVIEDQNVPSKVTIEYRAYGGKFARNARLLVEWVNEKLNQAVDPIEFKDLTDRPHAYDPEWHLQLWDEVYGWSYIKRPLDKLENDIVLDRTVFYHDIINDIKARLEKANNDAKYYADFVAGKAVNDTITQVSKQKLGVHLLMNLKTASEGEMQAMAKENFVASKIIEDKYINKKGLIAFTEVLKKRSVSMDQTNLGRTNIDPIRANRGAIISIGNGGIVTFLSKKEIINNNNHYEENVYPSKYPLDDRFTVLRVTHNLEDHGGVFIGFNNTTGEMYSGVLKTDNCFARIKWFKFYSEAYVDTLKDALFEHVKLTNNPHKLTKKQVNLDKVMNLPVITLDQVMGEEPTDSYITLDALQVFMTKHLLNLKPEFKEDGSLDKDSDPFVKPNVIFTPCDNKAKMYDFPGEGQLIKTFCDGTDRFARYSDGKGSYKDVVLELNSDDCGFVEHPAQGTILGTKCSGTTKMNIVADGRGGQSEVSVEVNSKECGAASYPAAGTPLGEECQGNDKVRFYADGNGGKTTSIIEKNSATCGFTTTTLPPNVSVMPTPPPTTTAAPGTPTTTRNPNCPERGTIVRRTCFGNDRVVIWADGNCGELENVVGTDLRNAPECMPTTTTTTTAAPRVKAITLYCSLSKSEVNQTMRFTGRLSAFSANTNITVVLERCEPAGTVASGNYRNWSAAKSSSVDIAFTGDGTWTFDYRDDGVDFPRNTKWSFRLTDGAGTVSNTVVVDFVGAGQGSQPTSAPPAPTTTPAPPAPTQAPGPTPAPTPAPAPTYTPQLVLTTTSTNINGENLNNDKMTLKVSSGKPNTNYSAKIMWQGTNPPWNTAAAQLLLTFNVATNSSGVGQNTGTFTEIFGPRTANANQMYGTFMSGAPGRVYVLIDSSKSNEIAMTSSNNTQTG